MPTAKGMPFLITNLQFADRGYFDQLRVGRLAVTTGGTFLKFFSALRSSGYGSFIRCFNINGDNIDFGFSEKTIRGFKITPAINGVVEYLSVLDSFPDLKSGIESVTTGGTAISFSELPSINYSVLIRCHDPSGNNVGFKLTNKLKTGFTITPAINATVNYIIATNEFPNIRFGIESVLQAGTIISFSSRLPSINYVKGIRCYDGNGDNIDFKLTDVTANGFKITPTINSTVEYIVIKNQ